MKPSHTSAPRQLSDCAFVPSADPIEMHVRPFDWQDRLVMWGYVIAAVVSTWVVLS